MIETTLTVPPEWIDANGHMHDSCYIEAFNRGLGDFFESLGLDKKYKRGGCSIFNLGMNLDYVKELFAGESFRISLQLIDWDYKRLHVYLNLHQVESGDLCATNERLFMHVDLRTRKSVPFPEHIMEKIDLLGKAHATLEKPAGQGRKLGIRRP